MLDKCEAWVIDEARRRVYQQCPVGHPCSVCDGIRRVGHAEALTLLSTAQEALDEYRDVRDRARLAYLGQIDPPAVEGDDLRA